MCLDPTVEQEIKDAFWRLVDEGKRFTAYDITRIVRSQTGIRVPHRDVRSLIRGEWGQTPASQAYNRDLETFALFDGNSRQAFVYRPVGDSEPYSPTELAPHDKHDTGGDDSQGGDDAGEDDQAEDAKADSIPIYPDKRWRIAVPVSLVRKLGVRPGHSVELSFMSGNAYLGPVNLLDPSAPATRWGVYLVDTSGNVRISCRKLEKGGVKDASEGVMIEFQGDIKPLKLTPLPA